MPHRERHSWVEEISKINKKINKQAGSGSSGPTGAAGGGLNLDFR
jgi:hypothetical protein